MIMSFTRGSSLLCRTQLHSHTGVLFKSIFCTLIKVALLPVVSPHCEFPLWKAILRGHPQRHYNNATSLRAIHEIKSKTTMFPSGISSFLLCLLHLLLLRSLCATADAVVYNCRDMTGKYTANSTYESNLSLLLSNLTSNGSRSGFSTAVVGEIPDKVYGLVLCRGDTDAGSCSSCLSTAAQDVLEVCPYEKEAGVWYDACLLRYSNQDFLSSGISAPISYSYEDPTANSGPLDALLSELVNEISDSAAYNSTRRFATGEVNCTPAFPAIYGLAQCTPDLSGSQCRQCLQLVTDQLGVNIYGGKGGVAYGVRCNLRYELQDSFFSGAPTLRLGSPSACAPVGAAAPPQLRPLNPPTEGEKSILTTVREQY